MLEDTPLQVVNGWGLVDRYATKLQSLDTVYEHSEEKRRDGTTGGAGCISAYPGTHGLHL